MTRHDFGPTITIQTASDGPHHVSADYVETYWLPIIGPTGWCLTRHVARTPGETVYDLADLGARIGILKTDRVAHTLNRLITFRWAKTFAYDPARLVIHPWLPTVPDRLLVRLPDSLQAAHRQLQFKQVAS